MNTDSKELLELLQRFKKHSKKDALAVMRGISPDGQRSLLLELRRAAIESNGQSVLGLTAMLATAYDGPKQASAGKKVAYSLLLPPTMLAALRALSGSDGAPVSQHIRTAIKAYLLKAR